MASLGRTRTPQPRCGVPGGRRRMTPVRRRLPPVTCALGPLPRVRLLALAAALLITALADPARAQGPQEQYRAFWVDTFNTRLNSADDVAAVIARAQQARANVLLVQVRRRGDAWYLDSSEPLPENVPIERDFDPLREVLARAHEQGLQVHAFVSVGAIWNLATSPGDPNHVFNRHGVNPSTGRPFEGRDNWLTRTLLPDGGTIGMGGHRFGNDYWIDLGHPDAASYTLDVLVRLVSGYDVDGLHLDRIRYPEISVSGQTPATGASVGYNETSVARFNRATGRPADAIPAAGDPAWSQWRRDQVTGFVRRLYLTLADIRPRVALSAAVVAFGAGPASEDAWIAAEPYWRVYQDWRAWQEEGIVDLMMPMVYKTQHTASGRAAFSAWNAFAAAHQFGRHTATGVGAYLNSIEGTLLQAREALSPAAPDGVANRGVAFFSMAANNAPVLANPISIPPGRDTSLRTFDDFASALVTGRLSGGQWVEQEAGFAGGLFADGAVVPSMPWKTEPSAGHLLGTLRTPDGGPVDTATVIVSRDDAPEGPEPAEGRQSAATETDGSGVFGAVGLVPGTYSLMITPRGSATVRSACTVNVTAGSVSRVGLLVDARWPTLAQCEALASEARARR